MLIINLKIDVLHVSLRVHRKPFYLKLISVGSSVLPLNPRKFEIETQCGVKFDHHVWNFQLSMKNKDKRLGVQNK